MGAGSPQGKVALPLWRGAGDKALLTGRKRQRLPQIMQFGTEKPRHQDARQKAGQSGTVSAKIWNRVAVKFSWSAGLITP